MDNTWILGQKEDPGPKVVGPESLIFCSFRDWKRGAEGQGQSQTDMGSPPPGFESHAIRTSTLF